MEFKLSWWWVSHATQRQRGREGGGAVNSLISMKSFVRMGTTQVIILKVRQVPDSVQSSKKWVEHGRKFAHRLVPVLQSRLALIAFYTTFTRIARDTGAALHRFKPFFVPLDHSTPVEPPSQQAATIVDSDVNETVSVAYDTELFTRATCPNVIRFSGVGWQLS